MDRDDKFPSTLCLQEWNPTDWNVYTLQWLSLTANIVQKMNLMCHCPAIASLLAASGTTVLSFSIEEVKAIRLEADNSVLHHATVFFEADAEINFIRCAFCCGRTLLLLACQNATIILVDVLDPRNPIRLSTAITGLDDCDAWSVTCCRRSPIIVASCNSHRISVFDISEDLKDFKNASILQGHHHNIPCVAMSPCDRFIASASIDCTLKVWDTTSREIIYSRRMSSTWGWAVMWFDISYLHYCSDQETSSDITTLEQSEIEGRLQAEGNSTSVDEEPPVSGENGEDQDELDTFLWLVDAEDAENNSISEVSEVSNSVAGAAKKFFYNPDSIFKPDLPDTVEGPLIVFCSQKDVFLLDSELMLLDVRPTTLQPIISSYAYFHRLNLIDSVPELSLIVVGSAASRQVSLYQISRTNAGVKLLPQKNVPENGPASAIHGICISPGSTSHTRLAETLKFWNLYLLFESGQMMCIQLRRSVGGSALDITGILL